MGIQISLLAHRYIFIIKFTLSLAIGTVVGLTQSSIKRLYAIQDINNSPIQLIDQLKGYYFINPVIDLV